MSARSYLSIGDVLTLLRQEFPDVTISKIRFLESQGLVNPERTPSGYRKFYEHDVERLRWVLRQQREHFLPLKVIKDRLDDGSELPTEDPAAETGAAVAGTVVPESAVPEGEPVLVGQRSWSDRHAAAAPGGGGSASGGMRGASGTGHSTGPTLPGIEPVVVEANGTSIPPVSTAARGVLSPSASKAAGRTPATPTAPTLSSPDLPAGGVPSAASTRPETPSTAPQDPAGSARRTRRAGEPPGQGSTSQAPAAAGSSSTHGGPDGGPDGGTTEPTETGGHEPLAAAPARPSGPTGASGAGRGSPMPAAAAGRGAAGASLSLEDLASASGLDVSVLEDLVEYGLMVGTTVGGLSYFDEEALAVAALAAGFARFGIEPRHLRLYKNAADREAGFVEQIVLPLVRQRNPEARARANEMADELARLGQQLRASLLRSALSGLLNG